MRNGKVGGASWCTEADGDVGAESRLDGGRIGGEVRSPAIGLKQEESVVLVNCPACEGSVDVRRLSAVHESY